MKIIKTTAYSEVINPHLRWGFDFNPIRGVVLAPPEGGIIICLFISLLRLPTSFSLRITLGYAFFSFRFFYHCNIVHGCCNITYHIYLSVLTIYQRSIIFFRVTPYILVYNLLTYLPRDDINTII
jgi:hypothetical protein